MEVGAIVWESSLGCVVFHVAMAKRTISNAGGAWICDPTFILCHHLVLPTLLSLPSQSVHDVLDVFTSLLFCFGFRG